MDTQVKGKGGMNGEISSDIYTHRSEVQAAQLRPTLCDPVDYTVHGILQARILQWVAFPFSRGSSQSRDPKPRSPTLQADSLPAEPPGKPKNPGVGKRIPSLGDLPNPRIKPGSPALQADSLPTELVKYLASGKLAYSRGCSARSSVMT